MNSGRTSPSLRGALATKQSRSGFVASGLLRFARNDDSGFARRRAPRNDDRLLRRLLDRRHPRQDDLDLRAAAGLRIEVEPPAQPIGDDAIDDMQAEPGAALVAPC